jgi:alpha-beta hydrolase superfamily lysophospholipase
VGGRLYPAGGDAPALLYFHGNGEIAADYDDIASIYRQLGITLLVMDYRGYGRSGGQPSAANLLADALACAQAAPGLLHENGLAPQRLYLIGRSLGSAAALEIASRGESDLAGLIIESGFADTFALLARLGLRVETADEEDQGFGNLGKIAKVDIPTLIIHGERDVLIPTSDGQALFEACGARDKRLALIPGAGHNDLMTVGMRAYFEAIGEFVGVQGQGSAT